MMNQQVFGVTKWVYGLFVVCVFMGLLLLGVMAIHPIESVNGYVIMYSISGLLLFIGGFGFYRATKQRVVIEPSGVIRFYCSDKMVHETHLDDVVMYYATTQGFYATYVYSIQKEMNDEEFSNLLHDIWRDGENPLAILEQHPDVTGYKNIWHFDSNLQRVITTHN